MFAELDDTRPGVDLVMSRALFTPPRNPVIGDTALCEGEAAIRLDALYGQSFIDEAELRRNIQRALQRRSQVSLGQIVQRFPIRNGLAEVVGYLNLASRDDKAVIADQEQEILHLNSHDDRTRQVRLPRVIFTR